MAYLLNRCRFEAGSAGTADFDDGTAVQGFLNLADAGAVNGRIYPYGAENATRTQWEIGYGTYNSSGGVLERTSVVKSSNSGSAVEDFSTSPVVFISPLVAEFIENPTADGRAIVQAANYAAMRTLLDLEAGTDFLSPAAIAAAYVALGGALGTPASGTLANCTGLPVAGITASTSTALGVGSIELGHATDTTLSRSASGVIAVEGIPIYPQIPQTSLSANTTLTAAHANGHLLHPSSDNNARTFTINSNANLALPLGTVFVFVNKINSLSIAITSDTLTWAPSGTTGSRTLAANGIATAMKIASTEWIISGVGLT